MYSSFTFFGIKMFPVYGVVSSSQTNTDNRQPEQYKNASQKASSRCQHMPHNYMSLKKLYWILLSFFLLSAWLLCDLFVPQIKSDSLNFVRTADWWSSFYVAQSDTALIDIVMCIRYFLRISLASLRIHISKSSKKSAIIKFLHWFSHANYASHECQLNNIAFG